MNRLSDTMEEFRKWVESVERASEDGLVVVCDAGFIRRLYDEINAGIGQGISSSLGLIIKSQQERDAAIAKAKGLSR